MTQELFQFAAVFFIASALAVVAKLFRQPVILAYLVTGVILSTFTAFNFVGTQAFGVFSDLGIMFLLFLVGLEVNYSSLRLVGGAALLLGAAQILITTTLGFFLASWFGFNALPALYIGIALTFSSTVVVVKLLGDKRDLSGLYAKLTLGLLVFQDIVAIFALLFLGGLSANAQITDGNMWLSVGFMFLKAALLFIVIFWLGRKVLPRFFDRIGHSQELLFISSLTWLFVVAAVSGMLGFSIAIAGFLAGFALANSSEHFQIATKMRPLRDFFILGFFVLLGSSLHFRDFSRFSLIALGLLAFVIFIKPLIVFFILYPLGYRKRTNFFASISISQVSEFSFILLALGVSLHHINEEVAALISIVGAVSIVFSSYLIMHAQKIYKGMSNFLGYFERKKTREQNLSEEIPHRPIILIGCHRTGESILFSLPREQVLVVDFGPGITYRLKKTGIASFLGDMNDEDVFLRTHASDADLVISTSPLLEDNEIVLNRIQRLPARRPKFIGRAETEKEARHLYKIGADYVLLPHFTSGQYLGRTIAINLSMPVLEELKNNDLEILSQTHRI
jgi:Kef-type K+ transport system membrane component KefB